MDNRCIRISYNILLLHDDVDLVVNSIMTKLTHGYKGVLVFSFFDYLSRDELISQLRTSISSFEILFDL